ncbi:ATP-binding protein [Actinobacillus porcitonsillarum]|uniref:ATP-binding protein n=1 Tax=Actinobacillus porcitonsillarum TaxID=189834 RepID=A0A2U8FHS7_9PAST|nr:ATP-binding protein [Actinobacillus porcitonsillarum]AWI50513.1 ATP-binding protein [Actinobacillus porcitonsillarum]
MKKLSVSAAADHLKRISQTSFEKAVAELIWNALDADATKIDVFCSTNELGIENIKVVDNGVGIPVNIAEKSFSQVGNSWKKNCLQTQNGRIIHGQKGEGRFKAFALGNKVEWKTIFKANDTKKYSYSISSSVSSLDHTDFYPVKEEHNANTGTTVEIYNLDSRIQGAKIENLIKGLTVIFSSYLYSYSGISIYVNGIKLDPFEEVLNQTEIQLELEDTDKHTLKIIEWKNISEKSVLLCKSNGAILDTYNLKKQIRSLGYSFSAYLCSPILDNLNDENRLDLIELDQNGIRLLNLSINKINDFFKEKRNAELSEKVNKWKEDGIYPYIKEAKTATEIAEKELFDIIAVNVEEKLPKFKTYDNLSKKFTFTLLSKALQDNPSAIKKILTEVLSLSPKDQDALANLLEKTTLPSIIRSAKIVSDRLNFITGLEELLFEHKKSFLERDQLHKILEKESWIFGEEYHLSVSEKRLSDVLENNLGILGERQDINSDGSVDKDRIDLMLSRAIEVRPAEFDYLVVELKRPSKKIDSEVISQIERYATKVANDSRFDKSKTKWKFLAISNEFDDVAELKANSNSLPKGQILSSGNIQIWIFKWSEIIGTAKARLNFYREQLNYEADETSMRKYLQDTYSKYLPDTFKNESK